MIPAIVSVGEGLYELGLEVGASGVWEGFGGDAANVAVMARRAGAPAVLVGRVGGDEFGRRLLQFWKQAGVDCSNVITDEYALTGAYANEMAADRSHTFRYRRVDSAGSRLHAGDVTRQVLQGAGFLVGTGVTVSISDSAHETWTRLTQQAAAQGVRTAFAVNWRPALSPGKTRVLECARVADVLLLSREDAGYLLGTHDERALRQLARPGAEVIISGGARGAWLIRENQTHRISAPSVVAVDTAGAGDALLGAYLGQRVRGRVPATALGWAVVAASLSTRTHGCALSYPREREVDAQVNRLLDEVAVA